MKSSAAKCAAEALDVVPLIMRTIRTEMRRSRTPDLSVPQFRALAFLNRNPRISLFQVAEHIGITAPSACKIIEGLVERKLVFRKASARDRRQVELGLSLEGKRKLERVRSQARKCLALRFASLDEREHERLIQAFERLREIFEERGSNCAHE